MAVPFRRKSSTRVRKGRGPSNLKFTKRYSQTPLVSCENKECGKLKVLHQICSSCTNYRGTQLGKRTEKIDSVKK